MLTDAESRRGAEQIETIAGETAIAMKKRIDAELASYSEEWRAEMGIRAGLAVAGYGLAMYAEVHGKKAALEFAEKTLSATIEYLTGGR